MWWVQTVAHLFGFSSSDENHTERTMESVSRAYDHSTPLRLPLFPRPAAPKALTLKPFADHKPFSPKSPIPLCATLKPPHPPPSPTNPNPKSQQTTLTSLLKPATASLAAAAALLLARLHNPSPATAVAAPAVQSETLPSPPSSKPSESPTEAEKERALEEHLDSHPDDGRSLRALMELKVKSGKLPEAISVADRLILLDPGDKDLPLLKSLFQCYNGDTETAKQGFNALLARDPFLVEAYHGLMMTASESDVELGGILERVEAAMEMCRKANRKEELRDFKLLAAQIRVMEGKYEEALEVYRGLVKEEPRDFRPYLSQGIIYTLLKKNDEAEKQFQTYRRLVPKGHPYVQYFDDNMIAMKVFSQMDETKRKESLKS